MRIADLSRLIALAAIWGASFLFVRMAVPALGAAWLTELRVALAAIVMTLYAKAAGFDFEPRRYWRHYLVMGGLNTALPWFLYAFAGNYVNTSYMAILNATTPWFAAICGAIWLGERFSWHKAAGLVLGLVGVALVVGFGPIEMDRNVILAALACIGAATCYALCGTYMKLRAGNAPSTAIATGSLIVAAVALLPALPGPLPAHAFLSWPVAVAVLGISLVCSAAAYIIYFRLLANVGPTKTLTVTFLIPVFGVLWGAVFLGERVGTGTVAGGAVILVATALVLELGRRREQPAPSRYNPAVSNRRESESP
jgi:drug/metabolite transporter (DMT)-like permease